MPLSSIACEMRLVQIAAPELHRRDVDRERERFVALLLPLRQLAARGLDHEVADRHDQSGRFGDRNEFVGRNQAVLRMVPAHQRFEARDAARVRSIFG